MECRNIRRALPALLDGDLRPDPAREVQQHVDACDACARELESLQAFLAETGRAMAYRGAPLEFEALRARMAAVDPLDELVRFKLPNLRVPGAAPRFVTAMILLAIMAGVPYAFRHTRQVYAAVRCPFELQQRTLDAALNGDRFPGDPLDYTASPNTKPDRDGDA